MDKEEKSKKDSNQKKPVMFGDLVPFGDPLWYQGFHSPYYKQTHFDFLKTVREFTEKEIIPFVHEWEENYKIPADVFRKAGSKGYFAVAVGIKSPNVPFPDDFDFFHTLILSDELTRCGAGGVPWGLSGGLTIGLPPVINFGSDFLKKKVVEDCILGKKIICLCISEPKAASDVAGIKTTAVREGDHYVVNGMKKWITNGTYADYFTVACRTGGPNSRAEGISLILLERTMPGITTRHMKCQGVWSSGTAFIEFDNVHVPLENLIGKENDGFKEIMYNFNFERWGLAVQANRLSRQCYEEAFTYAHKRETFGKKLIQHQAIRMKLADMARQIEATHTFIEFVTHQFCTMNKIDAMKQMGEVAALLKVQTTRVLELCAREAVHTFGGAGYVRGGIGEKVERIYRDVRAFSIPGGAEEILSDFAIRSLSKKSVMRKKSRL